MKITTRLPVGILIGFVFLLATFSTSAALLEQQRELFLQAEHALQKKQRSQFESILPELQDYSLYPYLIYQDLRQRLATATNDELSLFFYNYGNTPLAPILRSALLKHLAKEEKWKNYLIHYLPSGDISISQQCDYRIALLNTRQRSKALKNIDDLWLSGRRQSSNCEPLFQAGRTAGKITRQLIRQRAYLALEKDEISLANHLARSLSTIERNRIKHLAELYSHPKRVLKIRTLGSDKEATRHILIKAIKRLAGSEFDQATSSWNRLQQRFYFTPAEKAKVIGSLGLKLAWQHNPEGLKWLSKVNPLYSTVNVREWRVRLTLRQGDWKQTLKWLDKLSDKEKTKQEWRYWRARALGALGKQEQATRIYRELAKNRSYHGFLAADQLGQPYQFEQRPLFFSPQALQKVAQLPAIERAGELYQLGRIIPARREWQQMLPHLKGDDLLKAAKLADSWGWHDRAIFTLGRSDHMDDLHVRFPLLYREQIFKEAYSNGIDPAWIYGLIRQESAFMVDVRSHAGALGLMQLMPATARQVAKQIKSRIQIPYDVLKPDINLRLGVTYLSGRYKQFNQNPVLATAAYNAGPHRVNRWLPEHNTVTADRWIGSIPYNETRKYVKRVLTYAIIYELRLGHRLTRLQERMPPVTITQNKG